MDLLLLLKAALLGVIEGLTEFLPISSTGHLILGSALLDFTGERAKLFLIVIQSAAILAVVWEYRQRLGYAVRSARQDATARQLLINVAIAFVPLAALGLVAGKWLKAHLFNAPVVATTFILGGLIILWAERRSHTERVASVEAMSALDALKVGIAQAFALIPGTTQRPSSQGAAISGRPTPAKHQSSHFFTGATSARPSNPCRPGRAAGPADRGGAPSPNGRWPDPDRNPGCRAPC